MGKQDQLQKILTAVRRKLGDEASAVRASDGAASEVLDVVPTGIAVLDRWLLGCGGLPIGRIMEIYGAEGTGKTSLVLHCLAAVQRAGGIAIYNDAEASWSTERAQTFGVDPAGIGLIQTDSIESGVTAMIEALSVLPDGDGPPALLVWDSLASAPPKAELEGEFDAAVIGKRALAVGRACRVLPKLAVRKRAAIIFVNQIRYKIGVVYGNPETTPGGEALKYHVSLKLRLGSGKQFDDQDGDPAGKDVKFKVVKSRFSPPGREALVRLRFEAGWDDEWSTLSHAKDRKAAEAGARGAAAHAAAVAALGWDSAPKTEPIG